jgi:hypothetical protein
MEQVRKCVICGEKISEKLSYHHKTCSIVCGKKLKHRTRMQRLHSNRKNRGRETIMDPYKMPVSPLEDKYYGYNGILIKDKKTGELQCHICGAWFKNLSKHIVCTHDKQVVIDKHYKNCSITNNWSHGKLLLKSYRVMFGLLQSTPLVCEELRKTMVKNGSINLNKSKIMKASSKLTGQMSSINKFVKRGKRAAEEENKNGTCCLQLLSRMHDITIKLGRIPKLSELVDSKTNKGFAGTLCLKIGSYTQACKLFNLIKDKTQLRAENSRDLPKEFLIECIRGYYAKHKEKPTRSACAAGFLPPEKCFVPLFGSFNAAVKKALATKKK